MTQQEKKQQIINGIKSNGIFNSMNPKCINIEDDLINIAMVHKKTGCVEYVLAFNTKYGFVTKYDCFDHNTSAYELKLFENISERLIEKDVE